MIELYDVLNANRSVGSLVDFDIPDTYNISADNETTLLSASAGDYVIAYNFEINFFGQKDKAVGWIATFNGVDSVQYSESVSSADSDQEKNRLYGKSVLAFAGGDMTLGIRFIDLNGGNSLKIDTCNVTIERKG